MASLNSTQQSIANRIYSEAVNSGIPPALATLMVGQSANETGGWTSKFFIQNNNCFGYSCVPGAKWQNGCSTGNADNGVPVANYDSIEDSTNEMVDWLKRRVNDGKFPDLNTITDADQYGSLLKKAGYFQSGVDHYIANIKAWVSRAGELFRKR